MVWLVSAKRRPLSDNLLVENARTLAAELELSDFRALRYISGLASSRSTAEVCWLPFFDLQAPYRLYGKDQHKLMEATVNSFDTVSPELQQSFFVTTSVLLVTLYRFNTFFQ